MTKKTFSRIIRNNLINLVMLSTIYASATIGSRMIRYKESFLQATGNMFSSIETVPYPGDFKGTNSWGHSITLKRDDKKTTLYVDERKNEREGEWEGYTKKFIDEGNDGIVDKGDLHYDPPSWFFSSYHREEPNRWEKAGLPKGKIRRREEGDDMRGFQYQYNRELSDIAEIKKNW